MGNSDRRDEYPAMADKDLTPAEIEANRHFVRFVPAWIRHRKLTQAKVADKMGVSEGTMSKWLAGKQGMLNAQLWALCQILNIGPEEIVCAPGDTETPQKLRRAAKLLDKLPDDKADRWLTIGEDMLPPGPPLAETKL